MAIELLLGTSNPDKAREVQAILGAEVVWLGAQDHPFPAVDEDGDSLEANALKKARAICEHTGVAVLAEDSGLEVDALNGAPGVHTGRYAGDGASDRDNVAKLLAALKGKTKRRARFCTVAVVRFPDGREWVASGAREGAITAAPRGRGGFGYDPVFQPNGFSKTLAELPPATKNRISHTAGARPALRAPPKA